VRLFRFPVGAADSRAEGEVFRSAQLIGAAIGRRGDSVEVAPTPRWRPIWRMFLRRLGLPQAHERLTEQSGFFAAGGAARP
jgi:hypothetical protein